MHSEPLLRLEAFADGQILRLAGDWRLSRLAELRAVLNGLPALDARCLRIQGSGLRALDSAAALLLIQGLRAHGVVWEEARLQDFAPRHLGLLALVDARMQAPEAPPAARMGWLTRLGGMAVGALDAGRGMLAFIGHVGQALGEILARPGRLRPRELFTQLEVVGLEALAIVGLMTFLVGMVFAHLLATQIEKFGANIFVVDGVALALTRELSPMLTAILVAGRSGAAFTAQIGAMKVTEELDAISTLGLSPYQVLVLPRLLAIVLVMPLLTFFGDLTGLLGSALIAAQQLDITFFTFFSRLKDVLSLKSVFFGLYKAPVFAVAIALIACRNGFAVSRDARSVGERTTATVVQSLVAVILINAAFAVTSADYAG
ncbi:MAG TPA: ABC transporter permease [Thiobacillaceae bacterium]|nr:ABC transporter permease [Thiobacillaceae bacterium]HNU63850.1 ABC transporter permease [Thiobacillaceae bacterium]